MSRTRIISANKALYASPTGLLPSFYGWLDQPATANGSGFLARQLNRIDTMSFDIDLASARQDVREFGRQARIATLKTSDIAPTLSLGYYLTNGRNEHELGLNISGMGNNGATQTQFVSGVLTEDSKKASRNIYALVAPEGQDAFNQGTNHSNNINQDVIAFGNCFLTNYSVDLSVGEIPRADVEFVASNVLYVTGHNSGNNQYALRNPSLTKDATANADTGQWALPQGNTGDGSIDVLKPGDVTVTFSQSANGINIGGPSLSNICVQSLSLDLPLSRTPIECLGKEFAESQSLDTPIDVTVNLSALVKDFDSGSLQKVLVGSIDSQKHDITVAIKDRNNSNKTALAYKLVNAVLDNQSFSLGLDDNESVDMQFSAQVAGATSSDVGLFCSGQYVWETTGLAMDRAAGLGKRFYSIS